MQPKGKQCSASSRQVLHRVTENKYRTKTVPAPRSWNQRTHIPKHSFAKWLKWSQPLPVLPAHLCWQNCWQQCMVSLCTAVYLFLAVYFNLPIPRVGSLPGTTEATGQNKAGAHSCCLRTFASLICQHGQERNTCRQSKREAPSLWQAKL